MAKHYNQTEATPRQTCEQKYQTSRINLLIVVIFTIINIVLLVTNADSYFLFSAFIPYFLVTLGMLLCGRFPADFYTDGLEDIEFIDSSFFIVMLVIAIAIVLLYLLAWIMSSKNRVGWLTFALVLFGIDTAGMLFIGGISLESVIDIIFHGLVIYYLISGIIAHNKLKKLPIEEASEPAGDGDFSEDINEEGEDDFAASETSDYIPLRVASRDAKHRVLAEARVGNYDICYRRVKSTNELVINGNVYDELNGVFESPHTLEARIDGHCITASYTGSHSVIEFDGEVVAKKLRLI